MEAKDIVADKLPKLADAIKETLVIDGSDVKAALKAINEWLNAGEIPSDVELSKNELRGLKKAWLTAQCKEAFTASWNAKIANDCDDVFADSMLADTYLRLLGLKPISDEKKAKANLLRVFNTNYKANSPLIGAANLVRKDGSPLDEFNFQAHDVWIGIQYSHDPQPLRGSPHPVRRTGRIQRFLPPAPGSAREGIWPQRHRSRQDA